MYYSKSAWRKETGTEKDPVLFFMHSWLYVYAWETLWISYEDIVALSSFVGSGQISVIIMNFICAVYCATSSFPPHQILSNNGILNKFNIQCLLGNYYYLCIHNIFSFHSRGVEVYYLWLLNHCSNTWMSRLEFTIYRSVVV